MQGNFHSYVHCISQSSTLHVLRLILYMHTQLFHPLQIVFNNAAMSGAISVEVTAEPTIHDCNANEKSDFFCMQIGECAGLYDNVCVFCICMCCACCAYLCIELCVHCVLFISVCLSVCGFIASVLHKQSFSFPTPFPLPTPLLDNKVYIKQHVTLDFFVIIIIIWYSLLCLRSICRSCILTWVRPLPYIQLTLVITYHQLILHDPPNHSLYSPPLSSHCTLKHFTSPGRLQILQNRPQETIDIQTHHVYAELLVLYCNSSQQHPGHRRNNPQTFSSIQSQQKDSTTLL